MAKLLNREGQTPHLLHVFSTFAPAGPELRTVSLIRAFGEEYRHSILAMDGRTTAAERLPEDSEVEILESPPKSGSLETTLKMRRVLRDARPDLVLTYNWGAFDAVLAAFPRTLKRLIHHEDGFNADEAHGLKLRRSLARRLVLPRVRRVIVPSQQLASIAARKWKVKPQRLVTIPNGVDAAPLVASDRNPSLRESLGIPLDAPVIGAVGHLRPVKNLSRLLDVAGRISVNMPVRLLIVGAGAELPDLVAKAQSSGIADDVHFVGYQSDVAPFLRAMDVLAITSDSEQLPVSLLEAMACRLPVVATDVGDVGLALPREQRHYVVPLDPATVTNNIAARLRELLENPDLRRRLGALNRKRVEERYSLHTMCEAYREVYLGVLQKDFVAHS